MDKYNLRHLRNGMTLCVVLYFLIGLVAWKLGRQRGATEIFPVFSWSLFSTIPQPSQRKFDIVVYENDGQKLSPPTAFNATSKDIVLSKNVNATFVIQRMGKAYIKKDRADFARLRTLFEKNYLRQRVKYGLISETYNPIDKYRSNTSDTQYLGYFVGGS